MWSRWFFREGSCEVLSWSRMSSTRVGRDAPMFFCAALDTTPARPRARSTSRASSSEVVLR